MDGGDTIRYKS